MHNLSALAEKRGVAVVPDLDFSRRSTSETEGRLVTIAPMWTKEM